MKVVSMKSTAIVAVILALSACGGSGSDSTSSSESESTEPSAAGTQATPSTEEVDDQASTPEQPPVPEEPPEEEPVPEETPTVDPSSPPICELSAIDQSMLEAVNAARAQARLCGLNSMPSVPAVAWNCTLASVSVGHSSDMASNNFFSHTGSNGLSMVNRIENANYEYRSIGENIAAGQATVESVMSGWLESPGHCENIMSANYTELGAGRSINDNSQYRIYWTQNFGRPR